MPKRKATYALRMESGHPGYRNFLFIGTGTDLKELASSISRLADLSDGARIDTQLSDPGRRGRESRLAFAKCSEEKLAELIAPRSGLWHSLTRGSLFTFLVAPVGMGIFAVGAFHTCSYLAALLG